MSKFITLTRLGEKTQLLIRVNDIEEVMETDEPGGEEGSYVALSTDKKYEKVEESLVTIHQKIDAAEKDSRSE